MTLRTIGILSVLIWIYSACGVNKNLLFREAEGAVVSKDTIPQRPKNEYALTIDDKFTFSLFTNDGEQIINQSTKIGAEGAGSSPIEYTVYSDGTVRFPIIGRIPVVGKTVREVEDTLALVYETQGGYKAPYIQLKLTNQRVLVFNGSGEDARVIPLKNNNTTLLEVLAEAGGIADRGRADKVKLMRLEDGVRKVYNLDMSKIENLRYADVVVQANDYIYVEPQERAGKEAVESIAPIVSLLSSALVIITVFSNF